MSEIRGTVFEMERDKALGQDAASLRRELTRLEFNIKGMQWALEKIQKEAADTSRDGDARKLEAQMAYLAGTAEDALRIYR